MPEGHKRRRALQVTSAAVVLIVVGAGAMVALNRTGSSSDQYRTVAVSRGSVQQSLTLVGTAQRVSQVTAGLASAGTVSTVHAVVGQRVTAGQALATLDPTGLRQSLLAAQATLAKAEASLAEDQAAAASSTTTSTSSTGTTGAATAFITNSATSSTTSSTAFTGPVSSPASYVPAAGPNASKPGSTTTAKPGATATKGHAGGSSTAATKLGSVDLTAMSDAISRAEAALAAQQTACAPVLGSPPPAHISGHTTAAPSSYRTNSAIATPSVTGTPTPSQSGGPTSTPTTPPTITSSGAPTDTPTVPPTSPPTGPTSAQIQACITALQVTSQAQQQAQAAFTEAGTALTAAVKTVEQAATTAAATGQQSGSHGTGSAGGTGSATGTRGDAGSSTKGAAGSTKGATGSGGGQSSSRSGTSGTARSGQASGPTGASGASGASEGGASAGAGASPATRVASDQVSVLQAQASVSQAKAALAQATLTAPITGVVALVSVVAGQPAAAGDGFVIVGAGAAQVTAQVPLVDMPVVTSGLSAAVLPAGSATPTPGSVDAVGLLPASSTSGTTTFPATILVANPPVSMASGSSVSVTITTRTVPDAIRVPVSALSGVNTDRGSVSVLSADAVKTTQVVVGAVGGGWAQISSGLAVGDQVVIADVTTALPTNTTNGLRGLGGGAGGGTGGGSFRRTGTTGGAAGGAGGGGTGAGSAGGATSG